MSASAPPEMVRAEQLRLVLGAVRQSLPSGVAVAALIVSVLWPHVAHPRLVGWFGALVAARAASVAVAHRALPTLDRPACHRGIERYLVASRVVEGAIIGLVLAIGLPAQVPAVSILLMSLMGAICGNGVSMLAPRPHLYPALTAPLAGIAFATLFALGGTAYRVLGVLSVVYVVGQYGQVRLAGRRVREGIELRFENVGLVERLRLETAHALDARAEAERANAAKSQFLAAASHDLRQPVHALGLFLQALRNTTLEPAQRRIVDNAEAAGHASAELLDTLLDFSRLEAGVVEPAPRAFDLLALLDKLENELAPAAADKGLVYRSARRGAAVRSDPHLVELILRNLVSNAIRYTDAGGVLVGWRRRGAFVSVEVFDTGIGIAADQHEAVFREFHQLGNPERDRRKGLGLGLAIVRSLAEKLGHPLSFRSVEGRGSVFRLALPVADEPPMATTGPVPSDALDLAGARVLVIDDEAAVRAAMAELVASWGAECLLAQGGADAVALHGADPPPDVIVCDYRLRDHENGAQAIEALRRHWGLEIPAVLVTGDTAPERLREATATGVALLHKPVAPSRLLDLLYRCRASATV